MRTMRMLVMFDLPTGNAEERRSYARFRKFLIEDGYTMEQYSVYSRVLLSRDAIDTHLDRLQANLPAVGAVTVITLTEKQYEGRMVLLNSRSSGSKQLTLDIGDNLTLVF